MSAAIEAPTRPVLRYHGGKWRIAPWIISHFPEHLAYVEPFGGAGSVLLQKQRIKTEVWNDLDSNLYNLFRILRDKEKARELINLCALTPFSRKEFTASYEVATNELENARRFIVRSFFGFGSKACLSETQNGFRSFRYTENSPAVDWSTYPEALQKIVVRMSGVVIESEDALSIIRRYDREKTLFYCDPPYVHSTRNLNQGAYRHEMTNNDHIKLADTLHSIQGMAIVSGYDTELYTELYSDWKRVSRIAYADMCSQRTECLWISPQVQDALMQEHAALRQPEQIRLRFE